MNYFFKLININKLYFNFFLIISADYEFIWIKV